MRLKMPRFRMTAGTVLTLVGCACMAIGLTALGVNIAEPRNAIGVAFLLWALNCFIKAAIREERARHGE